MSEKISLKSPANALVESVLVAPGDQVEKGDLVAVLEVMKVQLQVLAPATGCIDRVLVSVGDSVDKQVVLMDILQTEHGGHASQPEDKLTEYSQNKQGEAGRFDSLQDLHRQRRQTLDEERSAQADKRHSKGFRTARENLDDLVDPGSFSEYGQMAVAAQRSRLDVEALRLNTAADGVITGTATINSELFKGMDCNAAVVINDYSVLAGTQGYFHHKKLDRILEVAHQRRLPVVMFTEGGGGRPGDTDVQVHIAGLDVMTWVSWSALAGIAPRIAVANGFNFAGNAALFGGADIKIATRHSWIGMAGPVMIEGGGLGSFKPTDIGPIDVQAQNGVVDLVAEDEAHATSIAKKVLGYFQGGLPEWDCADQTKLWQLMPENRRLTYDIRQIIRTLADTDSVTELRPEFGEGLITGFIRIEGRPLGLIANDCAVLGGAIDCAGAEKAAEFMSLCSQFELPLLSLCDTPGFMVGPDSEKLGAAKKMAALFAAGAGMRSPIVTLFLRKAYGLGAMAMAGGSFKRSLYSAAWPSGEFGAMGLEGAVRLGYRKELEQAESKDARDALFEQYLGELYDQGKAVEAAAYLEIDAVIDPKDSRRHILNALV